MAEEETWTVGPEDGGPRTPYVNPSSSSTMREVSLETLRGDGWRDGVTTNAMPESAPMGSGCREDGYGPAGPARGEVEREEGFGGATVDNSVDDGGMSEPIRSGLISRSKTPPQVEDAFDDEDDKGTHPPARRGALNEEAADINDYEDCEMGSDEGDGDERRDRRLRHDLRQERYITELTSEMQELKLLEELRDKSVEEMSSELQEARDYLAVEANACADQQRFRENQQANRTSPGRREFGQRRVLLPQRGPRA